LRRDDESVARLNIHHPLVVSLLKFHQALEALACENEPVSEREELMHTHYALSGFVVVVATVFILVVIHSFGHDVPGRPGQHAAIASYQPQ
jgi:hypothetical protein